MTPLDDANALNQIATMLSDPDWGVGMLEDINVLVERTGRSTDTKYDDDGDEISTWGRH